MVQSQYSDCVGHGSSTHHQSSSSFFGYDNQTQHLHSDSSFIGAYTTVTAEPQDLFSTRPKEVYDNLFAEDFSIGATATTCERNYGEDASYISKHDPIEPNLFQPTHHPVSFDSHFDSSFNAQVGIGCERFDGFGNENVEVYEEDMFSNFQVPENTHVCREEEYSHIDDGLLSDLAIMQQM